MSAPPDQARRILELRKPFCQCEVKWMPAPSGRKATEGGWLKVLAYVDARAVQDRLDEVLGPSHWSNEFKAWTPGKSGKPSQLCGISILMDNGTWLTKWDGAEDTDREDVKGGLSSAFKRAAVQWGIGRYLYGLPDACKFAKDVVKRAGSPKGAVSIYKTELAFVPPTIPHPYNKRLADCPRCMKAEKDVNVSPAASATKSEDKDARRLYAHLSGESIVPDEGFERGPSCYAELMHKLSYADEKIATAPDVKFEGVVKYLKNNEKSRKEISKKMTREEFTAVKTTGGSWLHAFLANRIDVAGSREDASKIIAMANEAYETCLLSDEQTADLESKMAVLLTADM